MVARSKLQFYGLQASFAEEYAACLIWMHLQGASRCRIMVPKSQGEIARDFLLEQVEDVGTLEDPSADVEQKPFLQHHKFWISLLILLNLGPFGLLFLFDWLLHKIFKVRG